MATIAQVSKAVSEALGYEVELVKGRGGFSVCPTDNTPEKKCPTTWYSSFICVYRIGDLTAQRWIDEVKELERTQDFRG